VTDGQIGRTPRRFEMVDAERKLISAKSPKTTKPSAPQPAAKAPVKQPERGFAETATAFTAKSSTPYLRLVEKHE